MAQIALIGLTDKWEKVEDLISEETETTFTFDSTKTYEFEGRGASYSLLCDPDSEPAEGIAIGTMIDNSGSKIVIYKPGANTLYCRSLGTSSFLNVQELEA